VPESTRFLPLESPFLPQKEPSKELEITGTETRTKRIYAESAQTLHTWVRLAHHPQVTNGNFFSQASVECSKNT
jgi:hypothetical protein